MTRTKKGQSSFEFVLIIGVMFIIFIAAFATIQVRMVSLAQEKQAKLLNQVGGIILAEAKLAATSKGDVYTRDFELPNFLDAYNYTMTRPAPSEVLLLTEDAQYVVFLDYNITGDLVQGVNTISKVGNNITWNS